MGTNILLDFHCMLVQLHSHVQQLSSKWCLGLVQTDRDDSLKHYGQECSLQCFYITHNALFSPVCDQLRPLSRDLWSQTFSSSGGPWLRFSLAVYHVSSLGRLEQSAKADCTGGWWSGSPPHKAALHLTSEKRWWGWSVQGARAAVSPCPAQWPSSGSGCQGCHTHGRADGCDLQGEQWRRVWAQAAQSHVSEMRCKRKLW